MTKIMLVEDDKSLREIYGVRLLAEGYDIVSAGDGEEALAMAIKERPALIITDVMMPKISGFDMLDILRSTTETRTIRVIVMTALGSEEQRQRGDQLGADRYLVKSQVGIEDVVRSVHEVLGDKAAAPAPQQPTPPPAAPQSGPDPATQRTMAAMPSHMSAPAHTPPVPTRPAPAPLPEPPRTTLPVGHNRVIQPIGNPSSRVDINELLDRELAREAGIDVDNRPPVNTTAQEKAMVQDQLDQFSARPTIAADQPQTDSAPVPSIQIDAQGNVITPTQPPQPPPSSSQPPVPPPAQ
jgi:CheY-like chemotaxis protein